MPDMSRTGLTIGQTGQMPGASCFWGPRALNQNTPLLVFHIFRLFMTHQNCRAFDYDVWYIGQGNW